MTLDQPGLDEKLQVPRDARLRLAEDRDQLADRQLYVDQKREEAQARGLARRRKSGKHGVESRECHAPRGHGT